MRRTRERSSVTARGGRERGLIPGVCNSNWIYHGGNYEATNGQTDRRTNERMNEWRELASSGLQMNNGGPNEIFQFAAGHRNISLPSPSRLARDVPETTIRRTTQVLGLATPVFYDAFIPFSPCKVDDYHRRTNAKKISGVKEDAAG